MNERPSVGTKRAKVFRKVEALEAKFRFLVAVRDEIPQFWEKKPIICLEWGLHVFIVFEIKSLTRVLDERLSES